MHQKCWCWRYDHALLLAFLFSTTAPPPLSPLNNSEQNVHLGKERIWDLFTDGRGAAVELGRAVPHLSAGARICTPAGETPEPRGCKQRRTRITDTGQRVDSEGNTPETVCGGSYLLAAAHRWAPNTHTASFWPIWPRTLQTFNSKWPPSWSLQAL